MLDHNDIRDVIWARIPESRAAIQELEADELGYNTHYTCVSQAFWEPVFEPALQAGDTELLGRCFALTDDMLGGDDQLHEVTQIRVVEHLCRWPNPVKTLAGPRLQDLVANLCDWGREAFPDAPSYDWAG